MQLQSICARDAKSTNIEDDCIKSSDARSVCIRSVSVIGACIRGIYIGIACNMGNYIRGANINSIYGLAHKSSKSSV